MQSEKNENKKFFLWGAYRAAAHVVKFFFPCHSPSASLTRFVQKPREMQVLLPLRQLSPRVLECSSPRVLERTSNLPSFHFSFRFQGAYCLEPPDFGC